MSDLALVLEEIEEEKAVISSMIYQLKERGDISGLAKVREALTAAISTMLTEIAEIR